MAAIWRFLKDKSFWMLFVIIQWGNRTMRRWGSVSGRRSQ